jgi:glycosyltransferase involved in cell wall biosynthesis
MSAPYHPDAVLTPCPPDAPKGAPLVRGLSVVLPAHDEAQTLDAVVRSALQVGATCAEVCEVLVVDDGSRDDTATVAAALAAADPRVRVITHGQNRGYGAALRSGFAAAEHEWIFYTDSDGQFDLGELPQLLGLLGRYDVVTGYRADRRDGRLRAAFGSTFSAAVNGLLGVQVRDVNCAFKVYPRSLFEGLTLHTTGALIDAEMLSAARGAGLRIGELPVTHRPRQAGAQSGARVDVVARAVLEFMALALRQSASRRARGATLAQPFP